MSTADTPGKYNRAPELCSLIRDETCSHTSKLLLFQPCSRTGAKHPGRKGADKLCCRELSTGKPPQCPVAFLLSSAGSLPPASFCSLFPGFSLFPLCTWESQAQTQLGPTTSLQEAQGWAAAGTGAVMRSWEGGNAPRGFLKPLLVCYQKQRLN